MAKRTDNAADTSNITGEYFLSVQKHLKDCFGRTYFVRKLVLWVWETTQTFIWSGAKNVPNGL